MADIEFDVPSLSTIKEASLDDLYEMLYESRKQLVEARVQHAMANLSNTSVLKGFRKAIARIITRIKLIEGEADGR